MKMPHLGEKSPVSDTIDQPERVASEALSAASGLPLIDLDSTPVSALAVRLVPEWVARRREALPIAEDNRTLTYATAQAFDSGTDEDMSFASGRQARPVLARPSQLAAALDRFYPRGAAGIWRVGPRAQMNEAGRTADGRKRVLVVDDDRMIRTLVKLLLERDGYTVRQAADGREGLEMAHLEPPDLIITDLQMPHVDGYEVLRSLRSDPRMSMLPVVVLTADSGDNTERAVLELGADDYLVKPFDEEVLLRRVRSVIARRVRAAA